MACVKRDVYFIQNCRLDRIVETLTRKSYDDHSWKEALPMAVDLINLKLKEFEETDWESGQRCKLSSDGMIELSSAFRGQIEYANRDQKPCQVGFCSG